MAQPAFFIPHLRPEKLSNTQDKTIPSKIHEKNLVWEGGLFGEHPLSQFNRHLCAKLVEARSRISLIKYGLRFPQHGTDGCFSNLLNALNQEFESPIDIHVQHSKEPHFDAPPEGRWAVMLDWRFGSLPKAWIQPLRQMVDEIWVPSSFSRECLIDSGVPKERVFVISGGVDSRIFVAGLKPFPLKTQKRFKFLYVGRTIHQKLIECFRETFSDTDDVCLIMKDMSWQEFPKHGAVRQLLSAFSEGENAPEIEYVGEKLDISGLARLYNACDCLLHPFNDDGYGLHIAEAMACGLPVIAADKGPATDFCSDETGYFVSSHRLKLPQKAVNGQETVDFPWVIDPDQESLKQMLKHVFDHPEEAATKGSAGRLQIEKNFTWEDAANRVIGRLNLLHEKPVLRLEKQRKLEKGPVEGMVSIILSVERDTPALESCIESIIAHTPLPYEIVLMVNVSAEERVRDRLGITPDTKTDFQIVPCSENKGSAERYNESIKEAYGEYILLLSADAVVTKGWLSGMLECMKSIPEAGVVGPLSNLCRGSQKASGSTLLLPEEIGQYAASLGNKFRHRRIPTHSVGDFCMLFTRKIFAETGGFDEKFGLESGADVDFCLRVAAEGKINLIVGDVYIHQQQKNTPIRTRSYFKRKWDNPDPDAPSGKKQLVLRAIQKGVEAYQRDNLDDAVKFLTEGIQHSPYNPRPYLELSEILLHTQNFKDTVGLMKELPQGTNEIWINEILGDCYLGMELLPDAIQYAKKAISLKPKSARALNLLGLLALRQARMEIAENFFRQAIDADPGCGEPHANLGKLFQKDDPVKALDLLERGFVLSPDIPDILKAYHSVITDYRQYERAEAAFAGAVSAYPLNKILKYRFIDVLIHLGKHEQAMTQIEEAMVLFGLEDEMLDAALKIRNRIGPREVPQEQKTEKATLSLCMIVRDEEEFLPECLLSVSPIVDEIIVVDTGSGDRTKDIARIFGAKVYDFTWCDDFSAARNFSISKAAGDWILVLDADEVISTADHRHLLELIREPHPFPVAFSFETRNYTLLANRVGWVANNGVYEEEAGIGWLPSTKVRLFPNTSNIRFFYPVHELVDPSLKQNNLTIEKSRIPVHHYGKLGDKKRQEKNENYYHIGLKKVNELGGDVLALRELAVQAIELNRYEEAIDLWERILTIQPDMPEAFINMGSAHWQMGHYEEAVFCAEKALLLAPHLKEAHFNRSVSLLLLGKAGESVSTLENLTEKEPEYLAARFMLGSALCCADKSEEALDHFAILAQSKLGGGLGDAFYDLAKRFISAGLNQYAQTLIEAAFHEGYVDKKFNDALKREGVSRNRLMPARKPDEEDDTAEGHVKRGNAFKSKGCLKDAVVCYRKASELDPQSPDILNQLGAALFENEQNEEAVGCYQRALALKPGQPDILMNMAMAHYRNDNFDGAVACFAEALKERPDFAEAYNGMALSFKALGQLDEAVSCCKKAISLKPDYAKAYSNLGGILKDMNRLDEAAAEYEKAMVIDPKNAEICHNLAAVFNDLDRLEDAIETLEKALRLKPDFSSACFLMAKIVKPKGKLEDVISWYEKGLSFDPKNVDALFALGTIYRNSGLIRKAISYYEKGVELDPKNARLHTNSAVAYVDAGELTKGLSLLRKSMELEPDEPKTHSNLIFSSQYDTQISELQLFNEAKKWAKNHGPRMSKAFHRVIPRSVVDRRLRIGYVSPDFHQHSVSWFFLSLLSRHDRQEFEIFCYSDVREPDGITKKIECLTDHWHPIFDSSDQEVATQIHSDKIDILVDLTGHTGHNRLRVFALKPAPIQVTWLGYPGTTGLSEMDYRITDPIADPIGSSDDFYTEKLVRLDDGFLCYMPPDASPEVSASPFVQKGYLTFGSFNNLPKTNDKVIRVWAEILKRVPRSSLFMKTIALTDNSARQHFQECFQSKGVSSERIVMRPHTVSLAEHLRLYREIDIALDTFPYNGTTTTCEAMWMGVPVISLKGKRHSARVGASILTQTGLSNLIAESEEEFIETAVNLAMNPPVLTEMRKTMRARMRRSSLCDANAFARRMENAYRKMHGEWLQDNSEC